MENKNFEYFMKGVSAVLLFLVLLIFVVKININGSYLVRRIVHGKKDVKVVLDRSRNFIYTKNDTIPFAVGDYVYVTLKKTKEK